MLKPTKPYPDSEIKDVPFYPIAEFTVRHFPAVQYVGSAAGFTAEQAEAMLKVKL